MTAIRSIPSGARHTLLLVCSQSPLIRQVKEIAGDANWRVIVCETLRQTVSLMESDPALRISALLVDVPSDCREAGSLISRAGNCGSDAAVIALAASPSDLALVEMLRAGAGGVVAKPLRAERLMRILRALASGRLPGEFEFLPFEEEGRDRVEFASIVGTDSAFRASLAKAAMAARGHRNVLIVGEGGTGKKMLAGAIHAASPRSAMPLRFVDLRDLAAGDVESTLFGHEKGAFPGAFERRAGAVQKADNGTLVLQAIDRLPSREQAVLARAIRDHRVRPVGASYGFHVSTRIIALSHRTLEAMVESGAFLAELYDLLTPTQLALPPLRQRSGDIALLAQHFLARFGREARQGQLVLSPDAIALLQTYPWTGNVRQLKAELLRAAALSTSDALTARAFPHLLRAAREKRGPDWRPEPSFVDRDGVDLYTNDGELRTLAEIEADVIRLAIKHYRGHVSEAARRLGIGRSTFYRKMAELGLEDSAA